MTLEALVAANLAVVRQRIERAAQSVGRAPEEVRLVAVSKTFGADHVRAAAAAGQLDFGENRVQEALPKIAATANLDLRWHLIGHLQSNKVRKAAGPFAWVHSVDSVDLLVKLDRAAVESASHLEALIQVDLADEPTKHGAEPAALPQIVMAASACQAVRLVGLMAIPPLFDDPEDVRPYFRRLRELRDDLASAPVARSDLRELSMGMSHDLEVAVQEGATIVRVGTAVFGSRSPAG